MCFLLENTEKSLSQKEWEEKLLLVRVPVPGRQRGGGRARGNQLQSSPRLGLPGLHVQDSSMGWVCRGRYSPSPTLTTVAEMVTHCHAAGSCRFGGGDAGQRRG